MMLKGDERLDYLLTDDMRIIQSPSVFSFSLDAVLLSNFTYVPIQKGTIVDLCSGNGVIPLMLHRRSKADIIGVEIQERLYDMAKRSIEYNKLDEKISMIHDDLKNAPDKIGREFVDVVTCNPPYFQDIPTSEQNMNEHYAIARHELKTNLEQVIKASKQLLKHGGKLAMVHRPGRMLDIVTTMRKHGIEPKRIQFVYPKMGKEANTLLIEGIKGGKADLKILPPIYVYEENNEYTAELKEILYGRS
ncbi:tRNA1(Val) (adenine(37)-N6)-methyltransferase [Gottfriedia acidiceleris]|uniref:tRNA1(Val) (adenine(37)-N6)-methyltransferase n=1 Tax=Gottfriedia acidiceleris TaxID=371036 RepID=UPI002FFD85CB